MITSVYFKKNKIIETLNGLILHIHVNSLFELCLITKLNLIFNHFLKSTLESCGINYMICAKLDTKNFKD